MENHGMKIAISDLGAAQDAEVVRVEAVIAQLKQMNDPRLDGAIAQITANAATFKQNAAALVALGDKLKTVEPAA